jgi:hypothetical protein
MAAVKNTKSVVAAAIARELAGFVWAEMTSDPACEATTMTPMRWTTDRPDQCMQPCRTCRGAAVAEPLPVLATCPCTSRLRRVLRGGLVIGEDGLDPLG